MNLSLSVGYGNGLFKDDGDLGDSYSKFETGGLFGGVKVDFVPARYTTLSLMAENNAWDYNLGAALEYRGLRLGAYITELASGSAKPILRLAFYTTTAIRVHSRLAEYIFALLRGDFLRGRVAELERQREGWSPDCYAPAAYQRTPARNKPLRSAESARAGATPRAGGTALRQEREALQRH